MHAADQREKTVYTQDELLALLRERFGDDPLDWAFQCPNCGDIATGRDFQQVLAEDIGGDAVKSHLRQDRDAASYLGQECIGRLLGALRARSNEAWRDSGGRGCDWCAYGLFSGPWGIVLPVADTARNHSCPRCEAKEGESCRTTSGKACPPHADRNRRVQSEKRVPSFRVAPPPDTSSHD